MGERFHSGRVGAGFAVAAGGVAGVDALEDARQLPVAEGDVEVEVGEVAAGAPRRSGRRARRGSGSRAPGWRARRARARRSPRRASRPSAGRRRRAGRRACRSPSRAPRRPRRCGVEDHVVEAVVAVDDRRRALLAGCAPARRSWTPSISGHLAGLRLLPLAVPARSWRAM